MRRTLPAVLALSAVLATSACSGGQTTTASVTSSPTTATPAPTTTTAPTSTAPYTPPPFLPVTSSPESTTVSTPPAVAAPATVDPATANAAMCQVQDDGGVYWLHVVSAMDHNFAVCAGYPLQPDDLDAIFASAANVDRRCLSDNDYAASNGALVGVYSSSKRADLAAARNFCQQVGWSND